MILLGVFSDAVHRLQMKLFWIPLHDSFFWPVIIHGLNECSCSKCSDLLVIPPSSPDHLEDHHCGKYLQFDPKKTEERLNLSLCLIALVGSYQLHPTSITISFWGVHHGMVPFASRLLFLLDTTQASLKRSLLCLPLAIGGYLWQNRAGFSFHILRWLSELTPSF